MKKISQHHRHSMRRDASSGLIVVVPLLVSAYVVTYIYGHLASTPISALVTAELLESLSLPTSTLAVAVARTVAAVAIFAVAVFTAGYLMRTPLGDVVERWVDSLMERVPVLGTVYNASKMATETAVTGSEEMQRPVTVEPWDGIHMTAFKTGNTTPDGRELMFLPTAPNISSGFVIAVDPDDYEPFNGEDGQALNRILSAGFGG